MMVVVTGKMRGRWYNLPGAVALRRLVGRGHHASGAGTVGQAALARSLSLNPNVVYAWKMGTKRPRPGNRRILERVYGIPAEAWWTAEERAWHARTRAA